MGEHAIEDLAVRGDEVTGGLQNETPSMTADGCGPDEFVRHQLEKVEPAVEPVVEPGVEPRIEPRVDPRVTPEVTPYVEP